MVVSLVFSWAIPTAAHNWIVINSSLAMVFRMIIVVCDWTQLLVNFLSDFRDQKYQIMDLHRFSQLEYHQCLHPKDPCKHQDIY